MALCGICQYWPKGKYIHMFGLSTRESRDQPISNFYHSFMLLFMVWYVIMLSLTYKIAFSELLLNGRSLILLQRKNFHPYIDKFSFSHVLVDLQHNYTFLPTKTTVQTIEKITFLFQCPLTKTTLQTFWTN